MKTNRKGFTLVEIMIVVAIIGILAAIAIPNFLRSRTESQRNACIANLKQIEGAIEQARLAGIPTPGLDDIIGDTDYIRVMPRCPTVDQPYAVNAVANFRPVCPGAVTGHTLP